MISNNISKYLERSNNIYNTKLTHIRNNFHNTIIRKFTITLISYRSSFNRINTSITSTNTITFINLSFPFPTNINISSFSIKLIIFFNYSLVLHTYIINISKNTSFSKTFPNYVPDFKKITISFIRS